MGRGKNGLLRILFLYDVFSVTKHDIDIASLAAVRQDSGRDAKFDPSTAAPAPANTHPGGSQINRARALTREQKASGETAGEY